MGEFKANKRLCYLNFFSTVGRSVNFSLEPVTGIEILRLIAERCDAVRYPADCSLRTSLQHSLRGTHRPGLVKTTLLIIMIPRWLLCKVHKWLGILCRGGSRSYLALKQCCGSGSAWIRNFFFFFLTLFVSGVP